MDALESGRIVREPPPIGAVGGHGSAAQVAPPIVRAVQVAVIDRWPHPRAGHIQPGELVGLVGAAADGDDPISGDLVQTAGNVAHSNAVAQPLQPAKFPRLGVIMQNLAQPLLA